MSDLPKVAIFWDYENCSPPSNSCGLGYDIVNNISRIARLFGSVTTFRAYLDISAQSSKSVALRSELQSSGLSLIDCPHNGKKDVVDKMILVDMLAFAVDHPTPATIILIAGDRDYAYAVSTLKLRKYQVILIVPSLPHTSPSLESQASLVIDWGAAALRAPTEAVDFTQAVRQPYPDLDADLVNKLERELQDLPADDLGAVTRPYSTASQSVRRITARELLEPSRHCRNTGSSDFTQGVTLAAASPVKSMSTGSDSAPGTLPIPRTPSRSQRTSVAMQARSTTTLAHSPLVVERDVLTNDTQSSGARRSSASDVIDTGPARRSPPTLQSLDTLELPSHESRPPSSIIVRSALERPTKETIPSFHKLGCLATPFVMTKKPIGLGPIPTPCTNQSHTTVGPTSLVVAPTKISECETPHTEVIGDPREAEHLTRLRVQDHNTSLGRPVPHPAHSTRNEADAPMSICHPYVALHETHSQSNRNVGLHLTDTPWSRHASPATVSPGVGDAIDLQITASSTLGPSTPSSESVSSIAFPSIPFTSTASHEHDGQRQTWTMFKPLVHLLLVARERGVARPPRSTIALDLVQLDDQIYRRAGVSRFRDYTALAEQAGVIELGGRDGNAWIALHPNWLGMDDVTTTRFPSPSFGPPKETQNPLLINPETPLIQKTPISFSPSFASPKLNWPETSITLPASPTDQRSVSLGGIPAQFRPLVDALIHMRAEGFDQVFRSVLGQLLSQGVYARAGVSGFKEYVQQASVAQLVQLGGVGGHAWIRLHPELRI